MNKENQKKFWRIFGCFIGIIVFFIAVLTGMIKLSEKKWTSGLKNAVQNVLDENEPGVWKVGDSIPLDSAFSTSAGLFELRSTESAEKNCVLIIRIATLYGMKMWEATSSGMRPALLLTSMMMDSWALA